MQRDRVPRRVLIVSADMGEGHNATGRALADAARRVWPDVQVRWVDVLDTMGTGPLFRAIYSGSVNRAPWLYEYFYGSVWRHRWFAAAAKRFIGAWTGRRLGPVLDRERPDLVLSTYPMGSTGLEWLRRHRGMTVPSGAWVSDFAPHPSWVHTGVDRNFVMHDVAVRPATDAVPRASVAVSAPPVPEHFRPGDRAAARAAAGLPDASPIVLVSCGSLGFGDAAGTVEELLEGAPDGYVVMVTGRNERQRAELTDRFGTDARVRVLGWVERMAELMAAADFVVTNAGGATSLEALACGRAVVMHRPIAGHGRANAALMERAGVARVCTAPGELAETLRAFKAQPQQLEAMEAKALEHTRAYRLEDSLRDLAGVPDRETRRALNASDALFLHAETPTESQYVGTVLVFEHGDDLTREGAARMLRGVPGVCGRLRPASTFRQAMWIPDPAVDPLRLVDEVKATDGLSAAADGFFTGAWDDRRASGAARIVRGLPGGKGAIMIKLHHALGDGITVLSGLLSTLDDPARIPFAAGPRQVTANGETKPWAEWGSGLVRLARAGRAPATPLNGFTAGPERRHALVELPGAKVRRAARELDASAPELLHALFADGLQRTFGLPSQSRLRVMVPWSLRGTGSMRATGNHTGAVSIDLPVGPMPLRARVDAIAAEFRARRAEGVPEAANLVVRMFGALPPSLGAAAARGAYRARWFNAIGTVMPGPRRAVHLDGNWLVAAYPVLALAPGTGWAWGALTWGELITLGFTGRPGGAADPGLLAGHVQAAFDELVHT